MSFHCQIVTRGAAGVCARAWGRGLWVALALACLLFPAAAVAAPNETVLSSRTSGSGPPDATANSETPAVSGDGRFVAFISYSPFLTPDDPTPREDAKGLPVPDVYVRDHQTNETRAVSIGSRAGVTAEIPPSISADGRYVLFASSSNNLADDPLSPAPSGAGKLYVRDLTAPVPTVEYVGPFTSPPGGSTTRPVMSANGRYVAFSYRSAGSQTDANPADVFVRDLEANTTTTVAQMPVAYGAAFALSADGRYLALSNGAAPFTVGTDHVLLRDLKGTAAPGDDTSTLVSQASDGTLGNARSTLPSVSADGRFVAFYSSASNLVPADVNDAPDIFVRDLTANTTTLVSRNRDGSAASASGAPSMSSNGRFISFPSRSSDVVDQDANGGTDVFVHDSQESTTVAASRPSGVDAAPATGGNTGFEAPSPISSDGRFVAFSSFATNMVAGDANSRKDVFRRELATAPAPPAISVNDVSVAEGDQGTVDATFTVTLSKPSGQAVFVNYATQDGTAASPGDYLAQSSAVTVMIPAGEQSVPVSVPVNGDTVEEPDENFRLNLSSPKGATIADSQGIGTIKDDDKPVEASINDASVTEGDVGEQDVTFTVSLASPSGRAVTVDYETADGTATTAASDYVSQTGRLNFLPGDQVETVSVKVIGDTVPEPREQFFVNLIASSASASIAKGQGTATVLDTDVAPVVPGTGTGTGTGGTGTGTDTGTDTGTTTQAPASIAPAITPVPTPDTTRPLLSAFSLSRTRFRAAPSGASTATAIGTRVSYTLSEPGSVAFRVERALSGRRVGGRCVRVTASNRSNRRCTRYPIMRGSFTDRAERGQNRFTFRGRLAGRALRPGRYRLRGVARDAAGNRSTLRRSGFQIMRR